MCSPLQQLDPKDRRWSAFANFSLVFALALSNFFGPAEQSAPRCRGECLEALRGLLLGFSIGIQLLLLRKARRCRQI